MIRLTLEKETVVALAGAFNKRMKFNTDKALDNLAVEIKDWLLVEQQKGTAGGWPALSTSYAQEKERTYPGRLILSRTGTLMESYLNYITINKAKRQVALGYPRGKVGYIGRIHQEGLGKVPARPFPVDQAGYDAFEQMAYRNFSQAVKDSL